MYNEDVKKQYIAHSILLSRSNNKEKYERGIINRFNRSECIEKEFGKDILDMKQDEFILFLEKFLRGGKEYQENTLSTIKSYCEWGIEKNISNIEFGWLSSLKISGIDVSNTYSNSMVKNEEDLIEILDNILDEVKRDTSDNVIRIIALLLFAGVQYDDIWEIKESDINLDSCEISYRGRSIYMSKKVRSLVSHNINMDSMLVTGKSSEHMREIIKEGYLISNTKEYAGERIKMMKTYNAAISKKYGDCERAITNTTIYDSGVFSRIYEKENRTGEIDCMEYLWARRNRATTITFPDRVKMKCRYEYDLWKKAFNLI